MKVRMKVVKHNVLQQYDGTQVQFMTQQGELISSFVSNKDTGLLTKYCLDSIHLVDVYAYKDKEGTARLGLRLEHDAVEDLF